MKPPAPDVLAAIERGEAQPCALSHPSGPPEAHFYCNQCSAFRCGGCVPMGICPICRAVVRSIGALLLYAKENRT